MYLNAAPSHVKSVQMSMSYTRFNHSNEQYKTMHKQEWDNKHYQTPRRLPTTGIRVV